jgi:hypothetical protein
MSLCICGVCTCQWRHRPDYDQAFGAIDQVAWRGGAQAVKGEPGCAGGLNRDRKIAS